MHPVKIELTLAELKELAQNNWAPFDTLETRILNMTAIVDELVAKVAEQTTQSAGLRVIIEQAVTEMAELKAALTAALAGAGSLSDEDKAKIQSVIDSAGQDTALDATAAQSLADAVAVNAT